MAREELQEVDHFGLCNVVFNAGCAEIANHRLKVFFIDQECVKLIQRDKILVEPFVATVEQACEEHGVLRDQLLVIDIGHLAEEGDIVDVSLLKHAVYHVPQTDLLAKLIEQGVLH